MYRKVKVLLAILIIGHSVNAQEKLTVIRANSKKVDIKEGSELKKGFWNISPELKPDVYTVSQKNIKVTFYTDIDSISFVVQPAIQYRFIILLNNQDSALTQINYVPSYLEILRKADKYNNSDKREIPKFLYQSKDNSDLAALRNQFKLDSIAGTGNEASKILNLMHWIHNLIPHDGQHGNPSTMNAISMIGVCKKEGRGLNCRGLAMTLNECYLALGFKSRYVTCLPKDSLNIDSDCHVINTVYAESLKKWIWIDPTNDAYVMNEKGELLGIEEVRERIILDKPLILNPDANWNRMSSTIKEDYLYRYMAKNLYILECPVVSVYNSETNEFGKIIRSVQLIPLDYHKQAPDKTETINNLTGTTFLTFKTNNPEVFWAIP
jgi:hypothetical protein